MRPDWVGEGAAVPVVEDVAEAVGVDMESEVMVIVGVAVVASGEQVSFKTVSYPLMGLLHTTRSGNAVFISRLQFAVCEVGIRDIDRDCKNRVQGQKSGNLNAVIVGYETTRVDIVRVGEIESCSVLPGGELTTIRSRTRRGWSRCKRDKGCR